MAYFFFVIISFSYLGAVETAKKYKCTQKQALDSKEFSAGYWNWRHLYLMDAVRQEGWSSAFITIVLCEWSFHRCDIIY